MVDAVALGIQHLLHALGELLTEPFYVTGVIDVLGDGAKAGTKVLRRSYVEAVFPSPSDPVAAPVVFSDSPLQKHHFGACARSNPFRTRCLLYAWPRPGNK